MSRPRRHYVQFFPCTRGRVIRDLKLIKYFRFHELMDDQGFLVREVGYEIWSMHLDTLREKGLIDPHHEFDFDDEIVKERAINKI